MAVPTVARWQRHTNNSGPATSGPDSARASVQLPSGGPSSAASAVSLAVGPTANAPTAAAVTAARTSAQPQPLVSVTAAASVTPHPGGIIAGFLRLLGLSPSGGGSGVPGTPAEFVTAVLALVRREFQKIFNLAPPSSAAQTALVKPATSTGTTTTIGWNYGTNAVIAFNPAIDKLNFGWMTSPQFTVAQQNGSTVISIVGNNQTYTLKNVTLAPMTMTNIIANDSGTVSTWQTLITNAAQATSDTPSTPKSSGTPLVNTTTGVVTGTVAATDPLGKTLTYSVATTPANGTVTINSNGT